MGGSGDHQVIKNDKITLLILKILFEKWINKKQ